MISNSTLRAEARHSMRKKEWEQRLDEIERNHMAAKERYEKEATWRQELYDRADRLNAYLWPYR